jgi:diaminohydroxyphosphoribosylaminopyrimidine deaminase/5-amino-6-(5-phosphoribosylamino)uracil reductase
MEDLQIERDCHPFSHTRFLSSCVVRSFSPEALSPLQGFLIGNCSEGNDEMKDRGYMELALTLARSARGRTWPNPMVGAVVVNEGRIVGMGAHLQAGTPHAEVHALTMAGEAACGGTLYVTLEPCSHFGRTPPCADRVIEAGIRKAVIAMLDPNPRVSGRGAAKLRDAGIEVEVGLCEAEARELNEIFIHYITKRRPFVIMKTAMTLDGKIAASNGDSRWVTGSSARLEVHRLRDRVDAILVGIGTVLADDPQLTTRLPEGGKNPLRIIVDTHLRIPDEARVLDTRAARTLIACGEGADQARIRSLRERGAEVVCLPVSDGKVCLRSLMEELGRREIASVLVEGGAAINGSLLQEGLIDQVIAFIAPKLIGGSGPTPIGGPGFPRMQDAWELERVRVAHYGEDLAVIGYPKRR